MKNKSLFIAILFAVTGAFGCYFIQSENNANLSSLALENVEALANDESGTGTCTDGCKDIGWGTSQILKCDCSYTFIFSSCNTWGCI